MATNNEITEFDAMKFRVSVAEEMHSQGIWVEHMEHRLGVKRNAQNAAASTLFEWFYELLNSYLYFCLELPNFSDKCLASIMSDKSAGRLDDAVRCGSHGISVGSCWALMCPNANVCFLDSAYNSRCSTTNAP